MTHSVGRLTFKSLRETFTRTLRWTYLPFLAVAFAASPAVVLAECTPIPGADQIWTKTEVRWVFIGEMHGSNETPAAFFNVVCDALGHGRKVIVALEHPTSEEPALEQLLTSKDLPQAESALLGLPQWKSGMDGRFSAAMLHLLLELRDLHRTHADLRVAAFDAPFSGKTPGARDEALGKTLLQIGNDRPDSLVLILTGNVHAMQAPQFGYDLAAMFIPAQARLSLEVTDRGGKSWISFNESCGPSETTAPDKDSARPTGIYLDPKLAPFGKVDGVLALGNPLTASAPADGDRSPLPACRIKFQAGH